MKARIRNTNIEVDVQPFYDETGFFAGFKDGYEYYRAADLIFPDTPDWDKTDWQVFRREAAKNIMCAVLSTPGMWENTQYEGLAESCIKQADELIKQLKEIKK